MRDIILEQIRDYYRKKMIIRDVIIQEQQGRKMVNVFDNLAANKWNLKKNDDSPDVQAAKIIIEEERAWIARQLYLISKRILERKTLLKKWNAEYALPEPKIEDDPDKLMDWTLGALDFTKVITYHEYEVSEPGFDESAQMIGMKQIPKDKGDEYDEFVE